MPAGESRRRRHRKPHDEPAIASADDYAKLLIAGGRSQGLEAADVIHAITEAGRLDGEAVRNVRVLQRFALAEVPSGQAGAIAAALDGAQVREHVLRAEPVRA
jgi:ATP-dependent RNA helicase DeaD